MQSLAGDITYNNTYCVLPKPHQHSLRYYSCIPAVVYHPKKEKYYSRKVIISCKELLMVLIRTLSTQWNLKASSHHDGRYATAYFDDRIIIICMLYNAN